MPSGSSTHGVNYSQCSDWIVHLGYNNSLQCLKCHSWC